MKYFKGIEEVKNATLDELMNVPGMNSQVAKKVVEFFNKD
jgi:excinuclease UvrABC nuclease subunit